MLHSQYPLFLLWEVGNAHLSMSALNLREAFAGFCDFTRNTAQGRFDKEGSQIGFQRTCSALGVNTQVAKHALQMAASAALAPQRAAIVQEFVETVACDPEGSRSQTPLALHGAEDHQHAVCLD